MNGRISLSVALPEFLPLQRQGLAPSLTGPLETLFYSLDLASSSE